MTLLLPLTLPLTPGVGIPLFITARKRSLGQGNIFTPVCHSVHGGGHAWLWEGACMVARGHVWLLGGHAWLLGGHEWLWGACIEYRYGQ